MSLSLCLRNTILFLIVVSGLSFSKTLHVFNPWDDTHVRVTTRYGDTRLANIDLNNCGWYTFNYYDESLEVKLTNVRKEIVGSNWFSVQALGDDAWVWEDGGALTSQSTKPGSMNGSCLGILSAEFFDWNDDDFNNAFQDVTSPGSCDLTTGLVKSKLDSDGLPAPDMSSPDMTSCNTSELTSWFKPVADSSNFTCLDLTLTKQSNNIFTLVDTTEYSSGSRLVNGTGFFPLDDFTSSSKNQRGDTYQSKGTWDPYVDEGYPHNYHFCMKTSTTFTYESGQVFSFKGDDDLWVFVDSTLVLDLGGKPYPASNGSIVMNDLSFTPGSRHTFDLFMCERFAVGSNLKIQTNIDFKPNTVYWNESINDSTWNIVEGNEVTQGCGASQSTITSLSKFYITKNSPNISNAIVGSDSLQPGNSYFGGGVRIDASARSFGINEETIAKNSTDFDLTLDAGEYYLVHQTTEAGRTDFGYVPFTVYPEISFSNNNTSQNEDANNGTVQLKVELGVKASSDVIFRLTSMDSTAIGGEDYIAIDTEYTIKQNEESLIINLEVVVDSTVENNEHIIFTLTPVSKAVLGSSNRMVHTILNDDVDPVVSNPLKDTTILEDSGSITIPLSTVFSSNEELTYTSTLQNGDIAPIIATISGLAGSEVLQIATRQDQNGIELVMVTAISAKGLLVTDTFQVTVTPVNDIPTITMADGSDAGSITVSPNTIEIVETQFVKIGDVETAAGDLTVIITQLGNSVTLPLDSVIVADVTGKDDQRSIDMSFANKEKSLFDVEVTVTDGVDSASIIITVEITDEFRVVKYDGPNQNEDASFDITNIDLEYFNLGSSTKSDVSITLKDSVDAINNHYTIVGNRVTPELNYNGWLDIEVYAVLNGLPTYKVIKVPVDNVNDLPYDVALTDSSFNENVSVCHELSAKDDDGDSLTFFIEGSDYFTIENGTQLCSKAGTIDYEAIQSGEVRIKVTDGIDTIQVDIPFDVIDELEYSVGMIDSVTNVADELYRTPESDSVHVLANTDSVIVYYTVEGVEAQQQVTIVLDESEQNKKTDHIILALNPVTNSADTLVVTISHNSEKPSIVITENDTLIDVAGGEEVVRLINPFTKEVQGSVTYDGNLIDTIYTNNKNLVVDKFIAIIGKDLSVETAQSIFSLEDYTLVEGSFNEVTDSVTDLFGNTTYYTLQVWYDTTKPAVDIVDPASGYSTQLSSIDVGWLVVDEGAPMPFRNVEMISLGTTPVIRSYSDKAGNVGADTVLVVVAIQDVTARIDMPEKMIVVDEDVEENTEFATGAYFVNHAKYSSDRGRNIPVYTEKLNGKKSTVESTSSEIEYGEMKGPEVVVKMTLPSRYPLDANGEPMTHEAPIWENYISGEIMLYDMIGQFLKMHTFRLPVNDPDFYDEDGDVILRYVLFMEGEDGDVALKAQSGRKLGAGIYILTGRFVGESIPINTETWLLPQKVVIQDRFKFGYRRIDD
ncbi:MAG: fibro-slime domain-containing protein [Fibrobacterales bacterium]